MFDPDAPLAVQVARNEAMEDPIYEGIVTDAERLEAHDHTIEIDLDGELSPGTEYWYRFVYRDVASRVGRCRTLPAPDDSLDSIRFAVLACQNYLNGDTLHDRFELWRSFEFGDLLTVAMTDERLFRDPPREAIPTAENVGPHREPPGRTMLGDEQRDWLVDTITGAETTWTVWTDEVLTVPLRIGSGPLSVYPVQGGWDGYTRERMHITGSIAAADVDNFVTLTGDLHCYVAAYKQTSYPGRVEGGTGVAPGDRLGVEFMTPAITSLNVAEALHLTRGWRGTITEPVLSWLVPAMNPHIEFFNSHNWGYSVVEFTPEECTYVGYAVDKTENSPEADRSVVAAYRVPEGRVELEDVTTRIRERAELAPESGR